MIFNKSGGALEVLTILIVIANITIQAQEVKKL